MQPYFFPYAGYFRLLHMVDHFVVFDCVQFPRRGRVHRAQVPGPAGDVEWLTLPLAAMPREVLIRDLAFAPDARARLDERLARHAWLAQAEDAVAERLRAHLYSQLGSVIDYLLAGIELVANILGLAPRITRSSALGLDPQLKAQDRVIAAVRAVGGTHYVNPPGGQRLYDPERFAAAGLMLSFLTPYSGRYWSLLAALASETPAAILEDIRATSRLQAAP
jgi:WbqC-like protein family